MKTSILLAAAALSCASPALATGTAVVRGTVYDAVTVSPIRAAHVIVESDGLRTVTQTDNAGEFEVVGVLPGDVRVVVEAAGLFPAIVPMCAHPDGLQMLDVPLYASGGNDLMNLYRYIGSVASGPVRDANAFANYRATQNC